MLSVPGPGCPLRWSPSRSCSRSCSGPGQVVADTKVNLYVDPGAFLSQVLSAWTPTTDLGHVWAGQYAGYAWPMAPWFAAGDALGLPVWLVHRLWLGTLLALAALGVVRLLQALVRAQRRRRSPRRRACSTWSTPT